MLTSISYGNNMKSQKMSSLCYRSSNKALTFSSRLREDRKLCRSITCILIKHHPRKEKLIRKTDQSSRFPTRVSKKKSVNWALEELKQCCTLLFIACNCMAFLFSQGLSSCACHIKCVFLPLSLFYTNSHVSIFLQNFSSAAKMVNVLTN